MPRSCGPGDEILSGVISTSGVLEIRVEKAFYDSTVSKILDMVENASGKKARAEKFITRFAKYYTPIVVGLAVAFAVIPPLFDGRWVLWIQQALNLLVVSCPCALVISVPLSFFGGIGAASKKGILVKGGSYLEQLSKADLFVFDKTGTLTKGSFEVTQVLPESSREEILRLIHDMPGEDPLWEEDETLRKQLHASILSRGDRRELVRLIRSLYLHKKERESKGKKFHQCDERCLKEAEELINSEFSLVLQIPPQQVVSFIRQQLEGPSPETA